LREVIAIRFLTLEQTGNRYTGGLENQAFSSFLHVCLQYADTFSLSKTIPDGYEDVPGALEIQLQPYRLGTIHPKKWYGYPTITQNTVQMIYSCCPASMELLDYCYRDIYLRQRNKLSHPTMDTIGTKPKWRGKPEDLCFWKQKRLILGTVTHETICTTGLIEDGFAEELLKLASWKVTDIPMHSIPDISYEISCEMLK